MNKIKWDLDAKHSELGFKIRHMMISNVSGSIKSFHVEAETPGEDFSKASILLTADMRSITTNNEERDTHLHSSDFFDVDSYPQLKFQSVRIENVDSENFTLYGELTLKGITKPITLNVEYSEVITDLRGGERAGFTVTGNIKRSDWGITFNRVMETGRVALGEEVRIISDIQLLKQVLPEHA